MLPIPFDHENDCVQNDANLNSFLEVAVILYFKEPFPPPLLWLYSPFNGL
jgi:hypothetical protein